MIWTAVRMVPYNIRADGVAAVVFKWHGGNIFQCALLLAAGIGIDQYLVHKKSRPVRGFPAVRGD